MGRYAKHVWSSGALIEARTRRRSGIASGASMSLQTVQAMPAMPFD